MLRWYNPLASQKRKAYTVQGQEKLFNHSFAEVFDRLAVYKNYRQLSRSELFQSVAVNLQKITDDIEYGFHGEDKMVDDKKFHRVVFWNLEGKISFEALSKLIEQHPVLHRADVFCFVNSDIGRSCSGNRNLVRGLALEKSFHYVSTCSFLHLNRMQHDPIKPDLLGIQGVSILSKFPITNFRVIPIANNFDPMRETSRKIGCEKTLLTDINLGGQKLLLLVLQLDQHSSPNDRARQLDNVLSMLTDEEKRQPLLITGNLQTTNYNTKSNLHFVFNLLNKIFRGFAYIASKHHLNPHLFFDKPVFDVLQKHHLHYDDLNEMQKLSWQKPVADFLWGDGFIKKISTIFVNLLAKLFFSHHDLMSFRTDWFVGNSSVVASQMPQSEKPRVVENYSLNDSNIITHTPLVLDFEIRGKI